MDNTVGISATRPVSRDRRAIRTGFLLRIQTWWRRKPFDDYHPIPSEAEPSELASELRDATRIIATFLGFLLTVIAFAGPGDVAQIQHDLEAQPQIWMLAGLLVVLMILGALGTWLMISVGAVASFRFRISKNARSPIQQSLTYLRSQLRYAYQAKSASIGVFVLVSVLTIILPAEFAVSGNVFDGYWSNVDGSEVYAFYRNGTGDHLYTQDSGRRREAFTYDLRNGETAVVQMQNGIRVVRLHYDVKRRRRYLDDGVSFRQFAHRDALQPRWDDTQ